jgi:hypothetical protein
MHRGNAYARHGDFDRAIADHSEAVRTMPTYFTIEATPTATRVTTSERSQTTQQASHSVPTTRACGANAVGLALWSASS